MRSNHVSCDREEFGKRWESNLNSFCEEIVACKGAIEVVSQFAQAGLPMAIATSSRKAAVDKKRTRWVFQYASFSNAVCFLEALVDLA